MVTEESGDDSPTPTNDTGIETPEVTDVDFLRIAWGQLLGIGVAAFVGGYILTASVIIVGPSQTTGLSLAVLMLFGLMFYSAHNVSVVSSDVTYNSLVQQQRLGDPSVPIAVFFLIPIVVLLATGAVVSLRSSDRNLSLNRVTLTTAGIAAGYAIASVAGTLLYGSAVVHPSYGRALLFGLAYPLVFAFVGGLVGYLWRRHG